jgi:hypothetical protein
VCMPFCYAFLRSGTSQCSATWTMTLRTHTRQVHVQLYCDAEQRLDVYISYVTVRSSADTALNDPLAWSTLLALQAKLLGISTTNRNFPKCG